MNQINRSLIVGIACEAVELKPVGVALRIIEVASGHLLGQYDSEIEWGEGQERKIETVRYEVGVFLAVHNQHKKPLFVGFEMKHHLMLLKKILGGDYLTVPSYGPNNERNLRQKRTIPLECDTYDLGDLNYPRALNQGNWGIAYTRSQCLQLLNLADEPLPPDYIRIAGDICRVVKKFIEKG